jgi:hypothetical protein
MAGRTSGSFDWRTWLVYTHRWLGIGGCVLFLVWFVSGVVLMYARMPSLSAEERLLRLPTLDLSRASVQPIDAAAHIGFAPTALRVAMLQDRPVYRFNAGRDWAAVYADTGAPLPQLTPDDSVAIARTFVPGATTLRHDARLLDSDQWTLSSAIRPLMPLDRVTIDDDAGTTLYVSARTGEAVLKSTRRQRVWGYLGAVMHWLYFTPLRRHLDLWVNLIVYTSLAGVILCLSGIAWGVWRFSPFGRYRMKAAPAHSPYAGTMKWHHYAGLIFGLTTSTWIFSGMMSMTPWDWSPGSAPTKAQREAVSGGALDLKRVSLDTLRTSLATVSAEFAPRELTIAQFRGEPFAVAHRPPADVAAFEWRNTDVAAFIEPSSLEQRIVPLATPTQKPFSRFPDDVVVTAAREALPGARMTEAVWLSEYDSYYYDRTGIRALPVLRARYDDAVDTWLYLDPAKGRIALKEERRSRLERWLYHGLHSLDFPFLYNRRPLWDVLLIGLSIGGTVLSATTLLPALRRLRRHTRRWVG